MGQKMKARKRVRGGWEAEESFSRKLLFYPRHYEEVRLDES